MKNKEAYSLLFRYLSLIILGLLSLKVFYLILTPLTVYPSFFLISQAYPDAILLENSTISFRGIYAQIIPACVAGAAYYLLLILNLSTPMRFFKRAYNILFILVSFLVLNILRIFVFAVLYVNGYQFFDFAHLFSWYFGSTALVVFIWFFSIWLFKIKNIPVYTDIKKIFNSINNKN